MYILQTDDHVDQEIRTPQGWWSAVAKENQGHIWHYIWQNISCIPISLGKPLTLLDTSHNLNREARCQWVKSGLVSFPEPINEIIPFPLCSTTLHIPLPFSAVVRLVLWAKIGFWAARSGIRILAGAALVAAQPPFRWVLGFFVGGGKTAGAWGLSLTSYWSHG